ncbi:cation transporter [Phragmitibacter flavus]|uniref:Cation transporter n=1 Tax=Phragmitibacter flavus TaxID=2576071 RepID=A0A5R8KFT7_9BACT|nr:cation diffusion facilitator family transporter [Phragmitibacter flavus]TLD71172.1 cation transporter [Phragmitibacter flavus]
MSRHNLAIRTVIASMAVNALLAAIKFVTGILGHSYALVADGIESINDVFASLLVLIGLKVASKPPDEDHPYGHGKAEQLAALFSALSLLAAAFVIAWQSIHNIIHRHTSPAWFTLPILVLVIVVKELMSRYALAKSTEAESTSLRGDAWHHRADAITSAAAFFGITIALIGGDGYEKADDIAALIGCTIIATNGILLLRTAVHENMDGTPPQKQCDEVRAIATDVPGVELIEKLRMKKSGLGYLMDIHVQVEGTLTVEEGHRIGHDVQQALLDSDHKIVDVVVHVEPYQSTALPLSPSAIHPPKE